MKAIVLAAGYATRLYPLTVNKAKPLLPVGDRPIINYILEGIACVSEIDTVYVVTNSRFYRNFLDWKAEGDFGKEVIVIDDGTTTDSDKLGAIGDINLVVNKMDIKDDLLVVGGDNLFSFSMRKFADFFKTKGMSMAVYKCPHRDKLSRYGIAELDDDNRLISFQEKPQKPRSNLVAICLYGFPRGKLKLINTYLEKGRNKDAPGYYLQWLINDNKEDVHAFVFESSWHDIGTPEAYEQAQKEYSLAPVT